MQGSFLAPVGAVFFFTLWLTWTGGASAHGPYGWVMENPVTVHCCGPVDCMPVAAREVRRQGRRWFVRGRPVPAGNVHLSGALDARYHACFYDPPAMTKPRCLFIPGMM